MSEDDELEKLREEKMDQLQDSEAEHVNPEDQMEQRREQIKQEAAKYLTKEARSRLGNIRAAQPDLASSVEMHIAQLGKAGRIEKVTDDQLKDILKAVQQEQNQDDTDIKFRR